MEIKVLKSSKDEIEVELDSVTLAEILRVYLNKDSSVKLGAWKTEHYSKPLIMKITSEGKSAKKALQDAIAGAQKDLEKYKGEFGKGK